MEPEWLYLWKPFPVRYGIPWESFFHMGDIPMEGRSIGITSLGKQFSVRPIYLWKPFPQVWYPLGNLFPYGRYTYYGKAFHRHNIPWEKAFHTADIPMERFSAGWLTPGKAHSIGWLYLWKVNSIRIAYVWKGIPYGYYRYGFGHQYQEYTYGMLTLCYPYSLPYGNPMETPMELRLY